MKQSPRLGFSLIELSIVILIIGILVIGIAKGGRIISQAKLKSAQALTNSSPINAIGDIAFWLDTTSEKSFDINEAADQSPVTNWYDINPNNISPFNVTQSTAINKPLYIVSGTNGLPTLRFDTSDNLGRANVKGADLTKDGGQITIFIVQKYYTPLTTSSAIFWESTFNTNRINIHAPYNNNTMYFDMGDIGSGGRVTYPSIDNNYFDKSNIITLTRRTNNTGIIRINGTQYANAAMTSTLNTGASATFQIMVGEQADLNEIILFKKGLTDSEINSVEQYLSAKWGLPLNGL